MTYLEVLATVYICMMGYYTYSQYQRNRLNSEIEDLQADRRVLRNNYEIANRDAEMFRQAYLKTLEKLKEIEK